MSAEQAGSKTDKESRILRAMKLVLTSVIKDTTTAPGMIHPLSDRTIEGIRQCLKLITARERELAEAAGEPMNMRPRYIDEPGQNVPGKKEEVMVPINKIGRPKKPEK